MVAETHKIESQKLLAQQLQPLPMQTAIEVGEPMVKRILNAKIHKCPYIGCNKSFHCKSRLSDHINAHTGMRPYKCGFVACDRTFTSSASLYQHHKHKHKASLLNDATSPRYSGPGRRSWVQSTPSNFCDTCKRPCNGAVQASAAAATTQPPTASSAPQLEQPPLLPSTTIVVPPPPHAAMGSRKRVLTIKATTAAAAAAANSFGLSPYVIAQPHNIVMRAEPVSSAAAATAAYYQQPPVNYTYQQSSAYNHHYHYRPTFALAATPDATPSMGACLIPTCFSFHPPPPNYSCSYSEYNKSHHSYEYRWEPSPIQSKKELTRLSPVSKNAKSSIENSTAASPASKIAAIVCPLPKKKCVENATTLDVHSHMIPTKSLTVRNGSSNDDDDEEVMCINDDENDEEEATATTTSDDNDENGEKQAAFICLMCPNLVFNKSEQLAEHLANHKS